MAAPLGGDHRRDKAFDDVDGAHEVDVDDTPPLLVRHIFNGAPDGDAGDVHEHVEAGVLAMDFHSPVFDGFVARDIERLRGNFCAESCTLVGDGVEVRLVDIGDEEHGALTRGLDRRRLTDATGGAGDEAFFAIEVFDGHGLRGTKMNGVSRFFGVGEGPDTQVAVPAVGEDTMEIIGNSRPL